MLYRRYRRWVHHKFFPTSFHQVLLLLHNKARLTEMQESSFLQLSEELCWLAQEHCRDMARLGILRHDVGGKTLSSRLHHLKIPWYCCGENLAFGFDNLLQLFKHSWKTESHRRNILRLDVQRVGFGSWRDAHQRMFYSAIFLGQDKAEARKHHGYLACDIHLAKVALDPKIVDLAEKAEVNYPFSDRFFFEDLIGT